MKTRPPTPTELKVFHKIEEVCAKATQEWRAWNRWQYLKCLSYEDLPNVLKIYLMEEKSNE